MASFNKAADTLTIKKIDNGFTASWTDYNKPVDAEYGTYDYHTNAFVTLDEVLAFAKEHKFD